MKSLQVKAAAKVNLSLDVIGRRRDGYHDIKSIFQSIGIFDIVTVMQIGRGIEINCDDSEVPCDQRNIAYKAAKLFFEYTGIKSGVNIHINKNIPSQAGLGGGSSDGAAVIYSMNRIFDTRMPIPELADIGGRISADTAFFIYGGTAFVEGIGDIINPIRSLPPVDIVVAKGLAGVSTPEAYKKIDALKNPPHAKTGRLLKAIDEGKFMRKCSLCENIFELVTDNRDVTDLKKHLMDNGAETALMSGSGSSVFGIFSDKTKALKCCRTLQKYYYYAEHCTAVTQGIYEI